ncbi:MAG TPA: hypothetical protein VGR71_10610 [Nitrospira sp.]|nr:hypothetical protein [Nitrospira sp.]
MSTTTASPDPTVTRTIVTPDLSKPEIGQPTLVAFFGADHIVKLSLAHVLSIGPVEPETGEPTLTVAFPTPATDAQPVDARKLGSVRWSDAYTRATGVQHFSHPDVKSGKAAIAWGGDGAIEILEAPEIPQPEGAGSVDNPIYQRHELDQEPAPTAVNEALLAQHGKAPEGAHLSPATSEAGATHDATVAATESTTEPTAATQETPATS